jgi:hypothetical protein
MKIKIYTTCLYVGMKLALVTRRQEHELGVFGTSEDGIWVYEGRSNERLEKSA